MATVLTANVKDLLVDQARRLAQGRFGFRAVDSTGLCVPEAAALVHLIRTRVPGAMATFQAGSHSWPITSPEDDDGVSPTHFSYTWEKSPATTHRLLMNELPEMHAWVVVQTIDCPLAIVDISTYNHKAQMAKILPRQRWTAPDPPDYLWCPIKEVPNGVVYKVDEMATILGLQYAVSALLQS